MRIKVFSAPHLHEALAKVRQQMGPEAIILDRQQTKTASGESIWHVHAAIDDEPPGAPASAARKPAAEASASSASSAGEAAMRRLERIIAGLGRVEAAGLRNALPTAEERDAFDHLLQLGVSASYAFDMAGDFAQGRPSRVQYLCWSRRIDPMRKRQALLFSGPTGAGKTTLIAKIATHYSLKGVRIALISTDTERMGGLASLESYAATLGLPLWKLRKQADLAEIHARCESAQLLLIDTEGWSPRHRASLQRQIPLWRGMACTRRFLVMPANMDEEDGMQVFAKPLQPEMTDLAFTKLDETVRPGKIVNWAIATGLPMGYCSFGPEATEQLGWLTAAGVHSLLGGKRCLPDRQRVAS